MALAIGDLSTVCPYSSLHHFSSSLIIWYDFSRRSFTTASPSRCSILIFSSTAYSPPICPSACLALGGSFPSASTKLRLTCAQQHRCNFPGSVSNLSYTAKPSLCTTGPVLPAVCLFRCCHGPCDIQRRGMEPGQIEVPHIPAVKSTGPVAFKYGMGCLIGHDVIAVLDQFTKFIIDWFQTRAAAIIQLLTVEGLRWIPSRSKISSCLCRGRWS